MTGLRAALAVMTNEWALSLAAPLATILSLLVPLNFLVLFVLFALSGGRVPAAVVQLDRGPEATAMVRALGDALTFNLQAASPTAAQAMIAQQRAVVAITVPAGFSQALARGDQAWLSVRLDNLNTDFADDVRRALPLVELSFYGRRSAGALPLAISERDTYPGNVGFLDYLAVSILSVAILLGGLLIGGRSVAGEWERGTARELLLAPVPPWAVVAGKMAAGFVAGLSSSLLVLGVLLLLGVRPDSWSRLPGVIGVLVLSLVAFLSLGVALGSLLRRLNAVTPLAFALGLPLFFVSGAFGPIAWGGAAAADVARVFPVVYANAALQHAFHGYWTLRGGAPLVWGVLFLWTALGVACSIWAYGRATEVR